MIRSFAMIVVAILVACTSSGMAQDPPDGGGSGWVSLFNGKDLTGWTDVNTSKKTWRAEDGLLKCTGKPIGVMRSNRQYENFILEIEWRHMKKKGNSGVFLWSNAKPGRGRLPMGMEVQMLELDWINKANGKKAHAGYISGELFGSWLPTVG